MGIFHCILCFINQTIHQESDWILRRKKKHLKKDFQQELDRLKRPEYLHGTSVPSSSSPEISLAVKTLAQHMNTHCTQTLRSRLEGRPCRHGNPSHHLALASCQTLSLSLSLLLALSPAHNPAQLMLQCIVGCQI